MKTRMFVAALCAAFALALSAPAQADPPETAQVAKRPSIMLPKNSYLLDVNENGVGTGNDGGIVARFDLSGKTPKVHRVPRAFGSGAKINDSNYVLGFASPYPRLPGTPLVLTGPTMASAWYLPPFYPVTLTDKNLVVGTADDMLRGTYYPVRMKPDSQSIELWDESLPNAWAVDADQSGNVLVQLDAEYDEDYNVVLDPMILIWETSGNVFGVGNGWASAISPNGRYIVADNDGPVRYDLTRYEDSVPVKTRLPLLLGIDDMSGDYVVDVNDFGQAVGRSGGKPAMWTSSPSAITLGNGGSVLYTETVEDLTAIVKIPVGYKSVEVTKITNGGAMVMGVMRMISSTRAEFRSTYVPPMVGKIRFPRPLQ